LEAAAKATNSPKLSTIAQSVRLDAFTKVKKAIDDMVAALLEQQKDEVKQRDFCELKKSCRLPCTTVYNT
jgi:hypothetical protein